MKDADFTGISGRYGVVLDAGSSVRMRRPHYIIHRAKSCLGNAPTYLPLVEE